MMLRLFELIRDLFPARCSQSEAWRRLRKIAATEPPPTVDKRTSHPRPAPQPPFKPKYFKETEC